MNIYTLSIRTDNFYLEKNGYFMAINTSSCLNEIIIPSDVKFMKLSNISWSLTLWRDVTYWNSNKNDILRQKHY